MNLQHIADLTDGFNGADVAEFCEQMKFNAIDRAYANRGEEKITAADVKYASHKVRSSVLADDIKRLEDFERHS